MTTETFAIPMFNSKTLTDSYINETNSIISCSIILLKKITIISPGQRNSPHFMKSESS
jgi:hypothetical protein